MAPTKKSVIEAILAELEDIHESPCYMPERINDGIYAAVRAVKRIPWK